VREKPALAALKEVVAERASALDLPEGLLCARRNLESLLVTRQWPAGLEGWRHEILHDALLAKLD
jgi:ribonuclease D